MRNYYKKRRKKIPTLLLAGVAAVAVAAVSLTLTLSARTAEEPQATPTPEAANFVVTIQVTSKAPASTTAAAVTETPSLTSGPTATPSPTTTTTAYTTLKKGTTGNEVVSLQQRLIELNYFSGDADGDFGDNTKAAVVDFQGANGLDADGIAGEKTLALLYSDDAKAKVAEAADGQ
jgi:murein L,D-transpeptidase YcbB/YkuD